MFNVRNKYTNYADEHVQGSLNLNCYHFFSVPFLFLGPQFPPPPLLFIVFICKSDVLVSLVHSRELRILDLGFSWWFPKACISAMTFSLMSNEL